MQGQLDSSYRVKSEQPRVGELCDQKKGKKDKREKRRDEKRKKRKKESKNGTMGPTRV